MINDKEEILKNSKIKCPACNSYSLIPFVYGLMSEEARIERGKRGEYAWGGCKISEATEYCKKCKKSFGGKLLKKLHNSSDNENTSLFRTGVN